jgi:inositol phosphorylceramide mannosyltransferase catalytic subunit
MVGMANLDDGGISNGPLGRVTGPVPRTSHREIPAIIHRVWIGGDEPDWLKPLGDSWHKPGWEVWQWGNDEVAGLFPLRNQPIFDDAPRISPHSFGRMRADLLRYEILHRFGGVYVDVDFECVRPIDDLLSGIDCFAAWEVPDVWIGNAILGATRGNPFMDALIENPYLWNELHRGKEDFARAYAVHHWQESRRRQRVPLEAADPR